MGAKKIKSMSPHSQNYLGEIVSPPIPQTKGYNIVPPIMNKIYIHGPNFDKKLLTPKNKFWTPLRYVFGNFP